VEDKLSEVAVLEEQLIENCLREDLRTIEQAHAFRALMRAKGWTGKELAAHLHLHPSSVSQALALLDLPADIREKVAAGALAPSIAYEVTKIADAGQQRQVVGRVLAEDLTLREARETVKETRRVAGGGPVRRSATLTYKTPRRWAVTVTATKQTVSELEVSEDLEAAGRPAAGAAV
jgi:ParB family chromosome partitioning protein